MAMDILEAVAAADRFFFKLLVDLPSHTEFAEKRRCRGSSESPSINAVATGGDLLEMGRTLRSVPIAEDVQNHLIRIVRRRA